MIRHLLVALTLIVFVRAAAAADAPPAPPPNLATLGAALAGTWQSMSDPKLTREFDTDGKTVERYEGDESATTPGRWMLFLGKLPPAGLAGHTFLPNVVYVRLEQNGDVLLFALVGLSRSDMKMVYLERGNVLSFARLK
ncbi:MAG: hypothetical protein ACLQUZ_15150 [Rhizomicrobium sp.]